MRIVEMHQNHEDLAIVTCSACGTKYEVSLLNREDATPFQYQTAEVSEHPTGITVDYELPSYHFTTWCPTCGHQNTVMDQGEYVSRLGWNEKPDVRQPKDWVDVKSMEVSCEHEGCTWRPEWLLMKPESTWLHLAAYCEAHAPKTGKRIQYIHRDFWKTWVPSYLLRHKPSDVIPDEGDYAELFKGLLTKSVIAILQKEFREPIRLISRTRSEFIAIEGLNLRTYYIVQGKLAEMGLKFMPEQA